MVRRRSASSTDSGGAMSWTPPGPCAPSCRARRPDHLDRRQPLRGHRGRRRQRHPRRRGAPAAETEPSGASA
jgi:hypothetical protein